MTKETAMKILKELHDNSLFSNRTALETLIPELAESEDERIRNALIRFHKSTIDIDGIKGADILAWLEKQGEQKPTEVRTTGYWNVKDIEQKPAEKKELKKIEDDGVEYKKHIMSKLFNLAIAGVKQKSESAEWSDEDEHRVEDTICFLDTAKKHYASTIELDACIDWLKSLKDRIGG